MKRIVLCIIALFITCSWAMAGPEAKKGFSNSLGMKFVYVKGGTFAMGSPKGEKGRDDNEKLHRVKLTRGFYMQTREVTVGQWRAFVEETGFKTEAEKGDGAYVWTGGIYEKKVGYYWDKPSFAQTDSHPVTCVSWNDSQAFIKWLSEKEKKSYALPTEAQWEYACRAGAKSARYWGDEPIAACSHGNVADGTVKKQFARWTTHGCEDGYVYTAPVGSFKPNSLGLYDMLGNVWEWCRDKCRWKGKVVTYTYRSGIKNPLGSKGSSRVVRGGAWSASPRDVRCAYRFVGEPTFRDCGLGFRLVRKK